MLTLVALTVLLPAGAQSRQKKATAPADPRRVGIIIGLGSGHIYEAKPGLKMLQRVGTAVQAWRNKRAKYILFSGGHTAGHVSEAEEMKVMAQAMGVPARSIIVENGSMSTKQNAENVGRIVNKRRFRSAILVTHASHMARAHRSFKEIKRLRRIYKMPADEWVPDNIELTLKGSDGEEVKLPDPDELQAVVLHGRSRHVDFMGDTLTLDSLQRALGRTAAWLYQQGYDQLPCFVWHKALAVGHVTRAEMIGYAAVAYGLPARFVRHGVARRFSPDTTDLFEVCLENGWTNVLAVLTPGREKSIEIVRKMYAEKGITATVIVAPKVKRGQ
jgi:hypothetical protein